MAERDRDRERDAGVELADELRRLRTLVRQAGEQFILRREGEIEELLGGAGFTALPSAENGQWLGQVRQLKLKPHKGRLRDLRAIRELLAALGEEMQEPAARTPLQTPRKKRKGGEGTG